MRPVDHDAPHYLHQPPVPGEEHFLSLALVNTRYALSHGQVDLLEDTDAARLWLVRHELLPDSTVLTGRQASRLRGLREALRELFAARAEGAVPSPRALDAVNAVLAAAPPTPRLVWAGREPHRADEPDLANPVGAALCALAEDGADLLTGAEAERIAPCGARGCTRWFLRSHAARRWCTTQCGNRVRAARHYASRKSSA
ncbi:CGNR zinc finger domain-containing protein [Streptomyces sp. NPDC048361]|uniref:CGNR zinc finger domain-containing protein n=1 Tax=Streptomyces sp. NPDC048361 TaxID=3154720 RepID=UPI0034234157